MARDRAVSLDDEPKMIMGFGNPLLDLMTSSVEDCVLKEWDVKTNNAYLAEDKHKDLFKKLVDTHEINYVAGGATLNSIRVAQWILTGGEKGQYTSYIGCIGGNENGEPDAFGEKMKAQLAADKVDAHFMVTKEKPTGTCAVLVKDGERALVANLAAAECYKLDHFKENVKVAQAAEIFYMAAFPLTHPGGEETVKQICGHAVAMNKTVCMNLSAPFIAAVPPLREKFLEALKFVSYLFCNESEAAELATAMEWGKDLKISEIAQKIASRESETRYGCTAIITQGADKTVVAHPPMPGQDSVVEEFEVMGNPWKLTKDMIKDTNGAGDAFVGGFLSQLACGQELETCVTIGHFAAGTIIQQSGCTCPDISTVEHVLEG